jgi:protein phosphatase
VQSLIDEGRITEEESRTHPHRNLILRAVDGVHETDPDLFYVELAPGDRVLLCSDGASGVLDQHRLADILGTGSVDYAVVELIRASLDAGSSDNVTCVVADVVAAETGVDGTDRADAADATDENGPIVVGAAAAQSRRAESKSRFRGHRGGDTGEIEPVPGDDGSDEHPADPEELRYAPQEPRRGRWALRLAALVALALVLGAAAFFGYRWSQDQYFVAGHDGRVAIFRGVQADIPGITMNRVAEESDVTIAALPDYPTEQVADGIAADSLADARDIVSRLTGLAAVCPPATRTPSPSAGASPRGTATAGPGGRPVTSPGARPSPTRSPTASPSPTEALAPPDCIEASS